LKLRPFILLTITLNLVFVMISLWFLLPESEKEGLSFIRYAVLLFVPSLTALFLAPKFAFRPLKRIKRLMQAENILSQQSEDKEQFNFYEFKELEELIINSHEKLKKYAEEEKMMALAFQAGQPILIMNSDLKIVKANPSFCKAFGFSLEELIGQSPKVISSGMHKKAFWDDFYNQLELKGHINEVFWNKTKEGKVIPFQSSINYTADLLGNPIYFISTYLDITKEMDNNKKLEKYAYSDALTGLYNRRFIEDELKNSLSRAVRNKHHGAILFMDLNKFKVINDTLGHEIGDLLLQEVALRLRMLTRKGELCCRLGGDEFLVLLPQISSKLNLAENEAIDAASRFQNLLSKPYSLKGLDLNIGASIGISIFPNQKMNTDELLTLADKEMYKSKKSGTCEISIHRNDRPKASVLSFKA
jgi:diguanylate cyclase (GGDEF)-like protein/PAS domain S-box-containing protein